MRQALLIVLLGTALSGCKKFVVRNASTYQAEVEWNQLAMKRSAELLTEAAAARLNTGDQKGCLEFAETAVVLSARSSWHSAMSLHLADLGEDPGDAPVIPSADTLCGEGG